MADADETIATLQRWVDRYAKDVTSVHRALDAEMPLGARKLLCGGLNYVLDSFDIFPDHYRGLGVADDAMVLRMAAAQAVVAGASDGAIEKLAQEAGDVMRILGELAAPLASFVATLPTRTVRARTVDQILSDKDVRVVFDADVQREVKKRDPVPIDTRIVGAEGAAKELAKMVRSALSRAGFV